MPDTPVSPIEVNRIGNDEPMHPATKIRLVGLDQKMEMIIHEDKAQDIGSEA